MTDVIQKKEKLVIMMVVVNAILPPLESPHPGGSNAGQIIKIGNL